MIKQIIIGVLAIVAAYFTLTNVNKVKGFIGDIGWAERFFGSGGSYLAIKLFGVLLGIFGFLYMTGTWDQFMQSIIGSIF